MQLFGKLPPLSEKQKEYARVHCHESIGYMNGELVWCERCGCEFKTGDCEVFVVKGAEYVCPMCGERLKVKSSTKRRIDERYYYTVVTTIGGWQVLRHYAVDKWMCRVSRYKDAKQAPQFQIREAVQEWLDGEGKKVIVARPRLAFSGYCSSWDFTRPMEVRREFNGYSYQPNPYNIHAFMTYPWKRVLPILKRNGLKGTWPDMCPSDLMVKLLTDSRVETLLKAGQMELLSAVVRSGGMMAYWKQAKIAIRNHYRVKEPSLWVDMLSSLERLGKDLHNAKYVCPENLKEAHDYWVSMRRKRDANIEAERKRKNALYWEDRYKSEKEKYFGVEMTNGRVTIRTIRSVAEMMEEGDEMHHCVGESEYYKKADSLILSARDENGKRLETIEVSLKTFKVLQCYGRFNKATERHQEILELVNENMNLIGECR